MTPEVGQTVRFINCHTRILGRTGTVEKINDDGTVDVNYHDQNGELQHINAGTDTIELVP